MFPLALRLCAPAALAASSLVSLGHAQVAPSPLSQDPAQAAQAGPSLTPAQQRIAAARQAIEASPKEARHHNALAMGLARRARETADPSYYDQAAAALQQSLKLAPENLEAQKLQTWVLLGKHQWAEALVQAEALQRRVPDDVLVYGFLVDANVELGRYAKAEEACQWMLDLRPGNVPGLTRASYLRELFGETQGAIDLLVSAFHSTRRSEREDLAWILTHIAHLERGRGQLDKAESALGRALELFPDYHYALKQLAEVRLDQGRFDEAAELLAQRLELAPHPENAFDLGLALDLAGQGEAAARHLAHFEETALEESTGPDNANRELIRFYADERFAPYRAEGKGPEDALELARRGASQRQDLYTRASLGEALLASGRPAEAQLELEAALAVGVQDARLAFLAGKAAQGCADLAQARTHLEASLAIAPRSRQALQARELLGALPALEVSTK